MDVWSRCIQYLEAEFPLEEIHTWIRPLQARQDGNSWVLYAPNPFILDHVREHYLPRIALLFQHLANAQRISIEVGSPPRSKPRANKPATSTRAAKAKPPFESNLDPHYTFANFIEGRSNQLGFAAACQAARNPGARTHNPLLLYGGTGLGKTHLMLAAGHAMIQTHSSARVLYLRSDQFLAMMMRALQDKTMDHFKRQFQKIDALLVDDIQFFAGKDRTQEEFFHTFNALFDGNQQIILSCDRYPRELEGLEARLRSRLAWGLSVAIEPPDFETRATILLAKARERQVDFPDEVAYLIAGRMHSNVRDLEGALNTLIARAHFMACPITADFARETLRDLLHAQQQAVSIANIQRVVADYYGLQVKNMLSKSRARALARPRQVAMALTKELTDFSLPIIGDAFAGRDHTTVAHACRTIKKLVATDGKLHEDWGKLIRTLSG